MAWKAKDNSILWHFINGDPLRQYLDGETTSILTARWYYLLSFSEKHEMKIAFQDHETGAWTRWIPFPGQLGIMLNEGHPDAAIDVHRSILDNEIVIECDYPTYEENVEASKIVGVIIQKKGFIPHYYYSGNKSIHIHVFLDWNCIRHIHQKDDNWKNRFIRWLRGLMIRCWNTGVRKFDADLIRATHLIRAELSLNKRGFKTFTGYSADTLPSEAPICNVSTGKYPQIGEMLLSSPDNPDGLVREFEANEKAKEKRERIKRKNRSLGKWISNREKLRECVKFMMSDDFKTAGDGMQRGMFILVNELKRVLGIPQAEIIIADWNRRMGNPVKDNDIRYRIRLKNYTLTCEYIHDFLRDLGFDALKNCT